LPSVAPPSPAWTDDLLELPLSALQVCPSPASVAAPFPSSTPTMPSSVVPAVSSSVSPTIPSSSPTAPPLRRSTRDIKPPAWLQGYVINTCQLQSSFPPVNFAMSTLIKPKFRAFFFSCGIHT